MTILSENGKLRVTRYARAALYSSTFLACLAVSPANAQSTSDQVQSADSTELGDILVTARKTTETAQKVPVVITAVTAEKLDQLQITQMGDLPTIVPGLAIGHFQAVGAQVALRGIGATAFANEIDQSVSLNIDGVQIGSGHGYKLGLFDLGQIEVLKGPQSLFYGKSTTGGVISLHTADPTDTPELSVQAGYEVEARTWSGEGILSGPLTDTLKGRFAIHYDKSQGYFHNGTTAVFPGTGAVVPEHDRAQRSTNLMMRGTLLWEPTSNFSANLKGSYADTVSIFNLATQFTGCTTGTGAVPPTNIPYLGGQHVCGRGRTTYVVGYDPAAFPGVSIAGISIPRNGQPFSHAQVAIGSLNLSYQPVEGISLDSTTGYYWIANKDWVNAHNTTFAAPPVIAQSLFHRDGFTQELRATSSFESPLNFAVGAFYEDGSLTNNSLILGNILYSFPANLLWNINTIDIKTYSLFGQLKYKIIPELEFAAGVRWADEKRTQNPLFLPARTPYLGQTLSLSSSKFMPDFTLTYIPNDNLTLFAAYRKGFKSGSFGAASDNVDNSFGDEAAKGGEIGIKGRLLDRQLALNIAAYRYKFTGLQVGIVTPPVNGVSISRVVNAGSAKTYGVDFDAAFRPRGIPGLELNGAINWNRGRFSSLQNVPCWSGQTIAQGCNQNLNTVSGFYTAQDLSGTALPRAPEWQTTFGGSYELKTASDYAVVFTTSTTYSSRYRTQLASGIPNGGVYQKAFAKFDLGVTLKAPDERWEVALIGKNINDKVIASSCTMFATQSGAVFGGIITGGSTTGPGGSSQTVCFPEAGREIWLRLTWRPFGGK